MRSYLLYSSSAHFLLLAVLFFIIRNPVSLKENKAYYIDFIGGSKVVTMEKAAASVQAPAAAKAAARAATPEDPEAEDFAGGLPKPSVLSGISSAPVPEAKPADADSSGGASLVTDSDNFPYPWYITQVREALWNAWTGKMPSGGELRCTVKFTIRRNGAIKGVSVEKSSGNRLFDYAAETSVESAAPFAGLPDDFFEDSLTVHVEFKAVD
ncbi:MAG TPA: hypothetical protein DCZ92_15115 [Elusimicrobia bacterium]|nr:MAG: hypothetical protein A2016_03295 [Elusimicrobia bacterium GWF2_62_30]HBA62111.1 hypothetical protein [Elusimicrobiota bacterium]